MSRSVPDVYYAVIKSPLTGIRFIQRDIKEMRTSGYAPSDPDSCRELIAKIEVLDQSYI